jgi:hypothetical protein
MKEQYSVIEGIALTDEDGKHILTLTAEDGATTRYEVKPSYPFALQCKNFNHAIQMAWLEIMPDDDGEAKELEHIMKLERARRLAQRGAV